jgi:hypothetical protein
MLEVLDVSGNQRMCGDAPSINANVQTSSTGLGQDCSALGGGAQQLSGIMGVVLGE